MSLLNFLGIASFLFVTAFTFHAYTKEPTPGQTPRSSIIEAWINILIGFSINYALPLALRAVIHPGRRRRPWRQDTHSD